MNILAIGYKRDFDVLQQKLGEGHDYTLVEDASLAHTYFEDQDVIFDFLIDEYPDNFEAYQHIQDLRVFLNIPKISLSELLFYNNEVSCSLIGFNGLPGFFENEKWELSLIDPSEEQVISELMNQLKQQYYIVDDRVGMVTPRVICMIINEAFYTVQEGTATEEDIDLGMKLGTNYPYGPFEWLDKIGLSNVYELLEALYDDTKEERYKIAPLLKKRYLLSSGS